MQSVIAFTKMHGLGNDFCIIDATQQQLLTLNTNTICHLANRHLGIGFDQLLIIRKKNLDESNFIIEIFNADGSTALQCGNGLRCLARYIYENKLISVKKFILTVATNSYMVDIDDCHNIEVDMGSAVILNNQLQPVTVTSNIQTQIDIENQTIATILISTGNHHAVTIVPELYTANINKLAKLLASKLPFVDGCNLCFAEIVNRNRIKLRVFERGAGETLACGSGACATVAALRASGILNNKVQVDFKYGSLDICCNNIKENIKMRGTASFVFNGKITI
jgi:diaminopimelate epimerase